MRFQDFSLGLLASICIGSPAVFAQDVSTAPREAQRLADCMKQFAAACVVDLADIESFELLGWPGNQGFRETQERFFDTLERAGAKYTRFDVSSPASTFAGDGRIYTFLPYVAEMEIQGRLSVTRAYFIGISRDDGASWRFVDGRGLGEQQLRLIIPSYRGLPLPPDSDESGDRVGAPDVPSE